MYRAWKHAPSPLLLYADAPDRDVQNGTGPFMSWEGWIGGWPGFPCALRNSAGGAVRVSMRLSASLNRRAPVLDVSLDTAFDAEGSPSRWHLHLQSFATAPARRASYSAS